MADLRIVDAPLLSTVKGTEKIPTGGEGNFSISVNQVADFAKLKWFLATEQYVDNAVGNAQADLNLHKNNISNPHQVTKEQVGLANVDNTADLDKPVSNATQSAIITANSGKADKSYVDSQDQLKADKVTVDSSLSLKADKTDLIASKIASDSGQTQQSVNDFGGDKWYAKSGGYELGATVKLENGDTVKSTVANNIINPNVDMTGWLKIGNLIVVNTVAELVAKNLKNGDVVKTLGYNSVFDNGGAFYVISNTATDYSIPLNNGSHAVFNDSFDIRKFGIVSSKTLDQTENIRRMIAYTDSREYEIDFLGYHIMTPKSVTQTRTGWNYTGMGFNYVHHIKNVWLHNDKTKTLQQGTVPIQFLAKTKGNGDTFKLTNVHFDLYVANYNIVAGEGDGRLAGFYCGWHNDYAAQVPWPANAQSESGYNLEIDGIYADTPAVTATLQLGLWCNKITLKNMFGDYIGYYSTHFATNLYVENVHGIFRDDLKASNRLLVTNLFQEEPDVGDDNFAYTQKIQSFKNLSCYKYSDMSVYVAVKRQVMGKPTVNKIIYDNIIGLIETAVGANILQNEVIVNRCDYYQQNAAKFNSLEINYCKTKTWITHNDLSTSGTMTFNHCEFNSGGEFYSSTINNAVLNHCTLNKNTFQYVTAKKVVLNTCTINALRIFDGAFDRVDLSYCNITSDYDTLITMSADNKTALVNFISCFSEGSGLYGANLVAVPTANVATSKLIITVSGSKFKDLPKFRVGDAGTLTYKNSTPHIGGSKTYDPPSLATATQQSTTLTSTGAKIGDTLIVGFSQPLQGTRMWAEVTAVDTITVYHRNDTGATVDVTGGTLTVKVV